MKKIYTYLTFSLLITIALIALVIVNPLVGLIALAFSILAPATIIFGMSLFVTLGVTLLTLSMILLFLVSPVIAPFALAALIIVAIIASITGKIGRGLKSLTFNRSSSAS